MINVEADSLFQKWDQSTAILTGNFLLAMGLKHLSEISDTRVHSTISKSIVDVCRGELFQFQDQFNSNQTITNYLRRINRKQHFLFNCLHKLVRLLPMRQMTLFVN